MHSQNRSPSKELVPPRSASLYGRSGCVFLQGCLQVLKKHKTRQNVVQVCHVDAAVSAAGAPEGPASAAGSPFPVSMSWGGACASDSATATVLLRPSRSSSARAPRSLKCAELRVARANSRVHVWARSAIGAAHAAVSTFGCCHLRLLASADEGGGAVAEPREAPPCCCPAHCSTRSSRCTAAAACSTAGCAGAGKKDAKLNSGLLSPLQASRTSAWDGGPAAPPSGKPPTNVSPTCAS